MKYNYLKNKNWSEITRDERTFCLYLFSAFQDRPDKLSELIQNSASPFAGFNNNLLLEGQNWELGYEVCFYRDLLFEHGKGIKSEVQNIKSETGIDANKLIKRTFDLCLFSEKEIVIIEAKSNESFNTSQLVDFKNDKFYINEIFEYLGIANPPKVYFVILASSHYYASTSFTQLKGIGKELLIKAKIADSLISWKQIAESSYFDKSFTKEKQITLWVTPLIYEILKELANQQIKFDLDDGVTENYKLFEGVVAKIQ